MDDITLEMIEVARQAVGYYQNLQQERERARKASERHGQGARVR